MRKMILVLACALLLCGCADTPLALRPGPPASFAPALARAFPLAVGVYAIGDRQRAKLGVEGEDETLQAVQVGSGFMLDASGTVATAAHVLEAATRVVVRLADGRVLPAEVVGEDPATDIAVLHVAASLPQAPVFGRSTTLQPGDWVLAIGEPFGLNRSVAAGIVSGKDRHFVDDSEVIAIQSDIAFNPGNSGGPLLDARGAIVGMNQRSILGPYGTPGVSLSAPIEVVQQIAAELQRGPIRRPRLGAQFNDLTAPEALDAGRPDARGALVSQVERGSLADRIGLRPDDIVVAMNGRPIASGADLARALLAWREAAGTRLVVVRDKAYRQLVLP
ncbi:S1C family serine protease [Caenimonas terrae]|uniref:S1C family serine protease n=1 Tax=Caenimonas terrae TaxID=696074 RepID=A0ABW0NFI5_9BURK